MRRLYDLSDTAKPAPIGHNGGPPLDVSWNAWVWQRAHKKAWASPGYEIVMMRTRRAERLGLSYREYTGVLMDRGVHLGGLVVMMSDALDEAQVMQKLATLYDCCILVCAARASDGFTTWLRRAGMSVSCETSQEAIRTFGRQAQLPPSALFLVGATASDRRIAEQAGLGLFVAAADFFGPRRP